MRADGRKVTGNEGREMGNEGQQRSPSGVGGCPSIYYGWDPTLTLSTEERERGLATIWFSLFCFMLFVFLKGLVFSYLMWFKRKGQRSRQGEGTLAWACSRVCSVSMSSEVQPRPDDSPNTSGGSSDAEQREAPPPEQPGPEQRDQSQPKKKEAKISSKTAAKLSTSAKR